MQQSRVRVTIKQILTSNQNWWNFYTEHRDRIRQGIVDAIVKLLSCKHTIRGYRQYTCSNKDCPHTKIIHHTCKSRACSSCGKKATELWIQKQNQVLPNTSWQHITFTMPSELWDFFWYNRKLLNHIGRIAAQSVTTIANKKHLTPGIFIAIHTFGRDLKRNVHVHLSTTNGGLTHNRDQFKPIFFKQTALMHMWRYHIITLFRKYPALTIPPNLKNQLNHTFTFNNFLDALYRKKWVVYASKPSNDYRHNVSYLGRYIKRPPIAESKLKHYDGHCVVFRYLDHTSNTYRSFTLSAQDFIARFIQHIPDKNFRMIRYYGFLAHRVRGKLLPVVYQLLGQEKEKAPSQMPTFSQLIQKNFNFDPLSCILCGQPLVFEYAIYGLSSARALRPYHRQLALLKKI